MTSQHFDSASQYDCIFIGTGIISILEAVHQENSGLKVLMIDKNPHIGGVWAPIELFGLSNVENAVHYFLPNPPAIDFMRKTLKWSVEPTSGKYRVFQRKHFGIDRLPYDNKLGRLLAGIEEAEAAGKPMSLAQKLAGLWKLLWEPKRAPSMYIEGGTPEIFQYASKLLARSGVKVKLSTEIQQIFVAPSQKKVEISTNSGTFTAAKLFVTHGARVKEIKHPLGAHRIAEQHHPRPAVHFLIEDSTSTDLMEAIFVADPLIKYAHDITRFANEAPQLLGKKKLFVLALQMQHSESQEVIQAAFEKLRASKVIGKDAILEQYKWWNIHLPTLDDAILMELEEKFSPCIATMKTEDFTAAISYRASEWKPELLGKLS